MKTNSLGKGHSTSSSLPGVSPSANLNKKTPTRPNDYAKDVINTVGWAFFLENKSASNADLWKEAPQIEVFPVKVLSDKMDLDVLEKDIEGKAEALKQKIEKRKEDERKKKEDEKDEGRR